MGLLIKESGQKPEDITHQNRLRWYGDVSRMYEKNLLQKDAFFAPTWASRPSRGQTLIKYKSYRKN